MINLVEKLNFKIDVASLREYYQKLKSDYQEYNWSYDTNGSDVDKEIYAYYKKNNKDTNAGGWAITFPQYLENNKAMSPWASIHKDFTPDRPTISEEVKTPMVFGIIDSLLDKIPYARNISLSVFEPGSQASPHVDEDYLLRVHIPIYTNDDCQWLTTKGLEPMHELGHAYLCDTRQIHAIYNDSKTDRVHLLFAIEDVYENELKSVTGTIK